VRDHPGYPKARIWEPVPPGQLFGRWAAVAHGRAHVVSLRSQSDSYTGAAHALTAKSGPRSASSVSVPPEREKTQELMRSNER
jgi:hypothetical protein